MDRNNFIRYILTATDRASRQVLAADSAIRKSVKETETASARSAAHQSSSYSKSASAAENASRRTVRSLNNQGRASREAREEMRKFGFEQTRAWRAGAAFDNHLRNTNLHLTRLRQSLRNLAIPALVAAFTTLAQAASTAGGGVVALVAALRPLGGLAATLPGGILGIAQAFTTLWGAISPVKQAITDYQSLWKSAANANETATNKIESAGRSLKASHEAVKDAVLQVADANRSMKQSDTEVERAQTDLNRAIAEGRREMVDLKNAAIDAAFSQQQAGLTLRQALEDLRKVEMEPSSMLEIEQAQLAVRVARQGVKEATLEATRARRENEKAQRGGVDKMPDVISAKRALVEAEQAQADASRGVAAAQRGVKRAVEDVKNAVVDAGQAASDMSSQLGNLKYDLAQLSPAGRQFAGFMAKFIKGPLSDLQKTSQTAFLPKLETGMKAAMMNMPVFSRILRGSGNALGYVAEQGGKLVGSQGFGQQLEKVADSNSRVMRILGRAGVSVAKGMMQIAVAARPLTTWLAHLVKGWADTFAATQKAKRTSGELAHGFEDTKAIIQRLVHIASQLWGGLSKIMDLAKPLGDSMFAAFDRSSKRFEEWTNSAKGESTIEKFFKRIKPALFEAGRLIAAIVKDIALMGMTSGLAPLLKQMRTELLPAVMEVSVGFSAAFGPGLIELLTSTLELFNALGHPLTVMLSTLAAIVDSFTFLVKEVPGLKQLLGVVVGISLASRAISFVSAITGVSALVGKLRDLRAANAAALGAGKSRVSAGSSAIAATFAERGHDAMRPLYVWVVNETPGTSPIPGGKRAAAKGLALPPGVAATTVGGEAGRGATTASRPGVFSRATSKVKGAFRSPKVAGAGAVLGTGALIAGSMIPGSIPGTDVGVGEAVSNIGGGAAIGMMFGPWGAAIGAAIGLLVTFRKQVKDALGWVLNFVKDHALLIAGALSIMTGGLPLIIYALVKWRKQIANVLGDAANWIGNAVGDIGDFFAKLPGRIVAGVKQLPSLLLSAIKNIPYVLGRLVGFFVGLPIRVGIAIVRLDAKIVGLLAALAPKVLKVGARVVSFLARAWWEGMKKLVGFWLSLPGRILDALIHLPGRIFNFGKKVISELIGGMRGESGGLVTFIKGLPGKVLHAIIGLAGKIYNAGKGFAKEFARGVYEGLPPELRDAIDFGAGVAKRAFDVAVDPFGASKDALGDKKKFGDFRDLRGAPATGVGPNSDDNSHRKTRKNWKDTADRISKNADDIRSKVKRSFDDQAKNATSSTQKMSKNVSGNFNQAREGAKRNLDKMQGDSARSLGAVAGTARERGQDFARSIRGSMFSATAATHDGLSYIVNETNKSLKAFNAPPINLKLKTPGKGDEPKKKASGGMVRVPGFGLQDSVPITHSQIAALVAPGEDLIVANRHQRPMLDLAVAETYGVGGLDGFFGTFDTPHYAARGAARLKSRTRAFAGGGFVDPSWDPGSEVIAKSIAPAVHQWTSTYRADITSGLSPNHQSPGHTKYGTATDVVPVGGWGASAQKLFESGLRYLTSRGFYVLYDGSNGTTSYPGHGPPSVAGSNAHAHIEWSGFGTAANALAQLGAMPTGTGGIGTPEVKGRGFTQRIAQAAITAVARAANKKLSRMGGVAGGPGAGAMPRIKGVGKGSPAENMSLGRKMMNKYFPAWRGEFGALKELWMGESGWDEEADNPTSTAYGIPQNISPGTYPSAGQPGAPSGGKKAAAQIWWGLDYIKNRPGYGNPANALAFKRANNWYARGTASVKRGLNRARRVGRSPGALGGKRFHAHPMPNIDALYARPVRRTTNTYARGGLARYASGTAKATTGTEEGGSIAAIARAIVVAVTGLANRTNASPLKVSNRPFVPNLELEYRPPEAAVNKFFGTGANPFPFAQYGFDPVELFDWEKFKKDSHWRQAEKTLKSSLEALADLPANKFKKWVPILASMNFKKLGEQLSDLKTLLEGQTKKLKSLVDAARDKTKQLTKEAVEGSSPGGEKITKAEQKTIGAARRGSQKSIEKATAAIRLTQEKQSVAKRIRAPLVRFHNSIQSETVGQLNAQQEQIKAQIEQVRKGGVSKKERVKLARLRAMMEDVSNTVVAHIQAVMQAAEEAVAGAAFAHNMASLGLERVELEEQLAGNFESVEAKKQRADYINTQIIPTLRAEGSALEAQLAAARESGNVELARQIAEQIAGVQNGILKEQLAVQELTKAEMEDLKDAATGALGFEFRSQRFTDLLGLGVGA